MQKRFNYDKKPLTKKGVERLLTKAAQPLPEKKSAPKGKGAEGIHPSDGYSGKCKSQGTTEGKEG